MKKLKCKHCDRVLGEYSVDYGVFTFKKICPECGKMNRLDVTMVPEENLVIQ